MLPIKFRLLNVNWNVRRAAAKFKSSESPNYGIELLSKHDSKSVVIKAFKLSHSQSYSIIHVDSRVGVHNR